MYSLKSVELHFTKYCILACCALHSRPYLLSFQFLFALCVAALCNLQKKSVGFNSIKVFIFFVKFSLIFFSISFYLYLDACACAGFNFIVQQIHFLSNAFRNSAYIQTQRLSRRILIIVDSLALLIFMRYSFQIS